MDVIAASQYLALNLSTPPTAVSWLAYIIIGGLAGLLEAEFVYRRTALGGISAEFQFPIA